MRAGNKARRFQQGTSRAIALCNRSPKATVSIGERGYIFGELARFGFDGLHIPKLPLIETDQPVGLIARD